MGKFQIRSLKEANNLFRITNYLGTLPQSSRFCDKPFYNNSGALFCDNKLFKNEYKTYSIANPNAGIKTYTFNNFKIKPVTEKNIQSNEKNIFEELRKIYRETFNIKINPVIMRKKRACHLDAEKTEAIIDEIIKEKWEAAVKAATNCIDPQLSKHLLKQAEKKEFPDLKVSLKSQCFPYIPCPLQQPDDYIFNNSYTYENTSLAPLFTTTDGMIVDKKCNESIKQEIKQQCISTGFWNQFANKIKKNTNEIIATNSFTSTCNNQSNNQLKTISKPIETKCKENNEQKNVDKDIKPETFEKVITDKVDEINSIENKMAENKNTSDEMKKNPSIENKKKSTSNVNKILLVNKITEENIKKKTNPTMFKQKNTSNKDKHLNLNYPLPMTSPNQFKHLKNIKKTQEIIKKEIIKLSKQKNDDQFKLPKYTQNKILKQLKRYYKDIPDEDLTVNLLDKNKKDLKQIINNIPQNKTNFVKVLKCQYPLTSPNNNLSKNKS